MSDKCECPVRKALAPFAEFFGRMTDGPDYSYMDERIKDWFGVSDFKEAASALAATCPCDRLRAENGELRAADRKSRESGCWCDEHGHPCAGCGFRQQRDDLRAENVELRQRLNDLKDWAKVAQQFAWAHEQTCPRNDADEPCNCGLDRFLGAPRPVVESFRTEIADLRKQARESAYKAAQMRGIVDAAEKLLCGLYEHILPLSEHTREVMRDLRNALGDERGDSSHDRPKYEPIVRGGVKGE